MQPGGGPGAGEEPYAGGLRERLFEDLGEPATNGSAPPAPEGLPDVERIEAVAAKYGIEISPPTE